MNRSLWSARKHIAAAGLLAALLTINCQGDPAAPAFQTARLAAGELALSVSEIPGGVRVDSLYDLGRKHDFLATNLLPLFSISLHRAGSQEEARLTADAGWQRTSIQHHRNRLELRWEKPDPKFAGITVAATATANPRRSSLEWDLKVENRGSEWGVWRVVFPQISLASLGEGAAVLFPRGPGELQCDVWKRSFTYHGNYPGGWCSMQFMAAYSSGSEATGLYVGLHDPWGSVKDLAVETDPASQSARLRFDSPAPNMGVPGNGFTLSGKAVWQLLRGDWFDAAMIYETWAAKEARWWPKLSQGQRSDTAPWMRQLNVWAQTGGAPAECVPSVERFQAFLDLPLGFHWYNWHQIPFDNDYPHYFPPKEGFARGVAELQSSNVFVMPYINGRLWDTHDRGATDFEFTQTALPAATKKGNGEPITETYGSKETNGEPVKLAVMCPTTPVWQRTVRGTVLNLLKGQGTKGVYIDQIAAAAPALCMDKSHGHPLGGGHWWNEGYWSMLQSIRREMPRGSMLTTECNGEPFIQCFDGYLTWHWQFDGQVPVFPAVYGGAIQMFGRAYRGGASKDLAVRMKAGQQLVFGEQLGWLDPKLVQEQANASFFRDAARLRSKLSRYFYAGHMVRPPRLLGEIPKVKADWQWSGEWWVSTDALLSSAWEISRENKLVFIFVNVSEAPLTTRLRFEPAVYGHRASNVRVQRIESGQTAQPQASWTCPAERELSFGPRSLQALEIQW